MAKRRKNKVLFVSHLANFYKFNYPFMQMFHEKGWEVHYASMGEEEIKGADKTFKVSLVRSPFNSSNIKAYKQLKKIIDHEGYDIIHAHTPTGGVVTRLAACKARKNGTKVIYTAHGFHFFKGAPLINWILYYTIERFMARFTDVLITINQEDYQRAKKDFKTRVEYVSGVGVDPKKFNRKMSKKERDSLRQKLGINSNDFVMIYVAEILKRKNQRWLIDTLEGLMKNNQSMRLLLVGNDSLNGTIKKQANKLGLDGQVHFLGYRKDIPKLLKASDLYVSSASHEGLAVNIMEAMASGLPIVAVNCRGVSDLLESETSAELVEKDDSVGFVTAVKKILNSPKKSYKYDIEKYTLSRILERMAEIYDIPNEDLSVDVVVPVYNSEKTIARCLDSVVAQTYDKIGKVIVVNDGSTDSSEKIIKKYQKKLNNKLIYVKQKNRGVSAARNIGIKKSKAGWIAFLDSDDYWYANKLSEQFKIAQKNSYRVRFIAFSAKNIPRFTRGAIINGGMKRITFWDYMVQSRIPTSTTLIRQSEIKKYGGFDKQMGYCEDQNLFMKIIYDWGVYMADEEVAFFDDKGGSGKSGLSSNLRAMHRGVLKNIRQAKSFGYMGIFGAIGLSAWENIKYIRRIATTIIRAGVKK